MIAPDCAPCSLCGNPWNEGPHFCGDERLQELVRILQNQIIEISRGCSKIREQNAKLQEKIECVRAVAQIAEETQADMWYYDAMQDIRKALSEENPT